MRNQSGIFFSLYREYELKILCVSVKLAYLGTYFQKNMQGGDLYDLQYCWDCNISVVFPTLGQTVAKMIDYIEKYFKRKLSKIKFPAKNLVEADFYLSQELSYGAPNICHGLELKSRFFLELKSSKIIDCIEKCFKQNIIKLNFQQKTQWAHVFISPRSEAKGCQTFAM